MATRPTFPVQLNLGIGNSDSTFKTTRSENKSDAKGFSSKGKYSVPTLPPEPADGFGIDSATVRDRMASRLAAQGIRSEVVLKAIRAVERHRFVDSALAQQAYEDTSLPIGQGQTISKPSVVARMIELVLGAQALAEGQPGRVLEIGTGCGYQAAVLSHAVSEVYSIERWRALHTRARDNLRPLRLRNLHLLLGDGMLGYARGGPYAAIISAAGSDAIPTFWTDQLALGGRLVAPLADAHGNQSLIIIDKFRTGLQQSTLEAVHFVPLKSGIA